MAQTALKGKIAVVTGAASG
ncbi:MAG: hypothetical protein WC830_10325, partial [Burkholderiales bacterium]